MGPVNGDEFQGLNAARRGDKAKPEQTEGFLTGLNANLVGFEHQQYRDGLAVELPILFVIGPPRSGTTLAAQLLAYHLDSGYIDNIAARFWHAPLTGVKLSNAILAASPRPALGSDYGATAEPGGLHEFGYFWRNWLNKHTFADIAQPERSAAGIDWRGLRRTLANLQHWFQRPLVFKNMLGSYHMAELQQSLGPVLFVEVRRDPLDTAVSILNARQTFYDNPQHWWSYAPPEVEDLRGLDTKEQVAGQIHYLRRLFRHQANQWPGEECPVLAVEYEELCGDPIGFLERVRTSCQRLYGTAPALGSEPPITLPCSRHHQAPEERRQFAELLERFEQRDPIEEPHG
jgi:hypothetical protein